MLFTYDGHTGLSAPVEWCEIQKINRPFFIKAQLWASFLLRWRYSSCIIISTALCWLRAHKSSVVFCIFIENESIVTQSFVNNCGSSKIYLLTYFWHLRICDYLSVYLSKPYALYVLLLEDTDCAVISNMIRQRHNVCVEQVTGRVRVCVEQVTGRVRVGSRCGSITAERLSLDKRCCMLGSLVSSRLGLVVFVTSRSFVLIYISVF